MKVFTSYDKIKDLIYTEKSNKQLPDGKYHFRVDNSCTKSEISSIIKKVFSVDVESVNIVNVPEKIKRFKGVLGTKPSYKKAIVTLKKGHSINFTSHGS